MLHRSALSFHFDHLLAEDVSTKLLLPSPWLATLSARLAMKVSLAGRVGEFSVIKAFRLLEQLSSKRPNLLPFHSRSRRVAKKFSTLSLFLPKNFALVVLATLVNFVLRSVFRKDLFHRSFLLPSGKWVFVVRDLSELGLHQLSYDYFNWPYPLEISFSLGSHARLVLSSLRVYFD